MFVLLVLMAVLIGMALLMGEHVESLTTVAYEYGVERPEVFSLTDEKRKLVAMVSRHPCLMYLRNIASAHHGWVSDNILHNVWTATATYAAQQREIIVTNHTTGLNCSLSAYRNSP
jgi:predicted transcriptional regulator